jgi:hypothetical protein
VRTSDAAITKIVPANVCFIARSWLKIMISFCEPCVGHALAQCHLTLPTAVHLREVVGRTPWSAAGTPGRPAWLWKCLILRLSGRTRASRADQEVRPTNLRRIVVRMQSEWHCALACQAAYEACPLLEPGGERFWRCTESRKRGLVPVTAYSRRRTVLGNCGLTSGRPGSPPGHVIGAERPYRPVLSFFRGTTRYTVSPARSKGAIS